MRTKKIVNTGLFTTLCLIATLIHIPSFFTLGYVNLGDGFVIASGFLLGPFSGAIAGGIGSMLADFALGYSIYAPGTLVIKGLMGFLAGISVKIFLKIKNKKGFLFLKIITAILAELIMVAGYIFYESYILGFGLVAFGHIFGDICQAVSGIVFSCVITKILKKYVGVSKRIEMM